MWSRALVSQVHICSKRHHPPAHGRDGLTPEQRSNLKHICLAGLHRENSRPCPVATQKVYRRCIVKFILVDGFHRWPPRQSMAMMADT